MSILTGKVRLSYPHLLQPSTFAQGQGEPKYSACLLIDKQDSMTLDRLRRAQEEAIQLAVATRWNGKRPANLRLPIRDGDTEREGEEYKGKFFINASSKRRPAVVDRDCNEIINSAEIYAGCYVRATLTCYAYDYAGNRGIAFGLGNVQKIADGEPLGGGTRSASSDFGSPVAAAELDALDDF